jgi:predicted ABC-type ATPase
MASEKISHFARESAYQGIERAALESSKPQERPRAIVLGGQPGSGKSVLAAEAISELRARGGAILIDADRMREQNPEYKQLSRQDPQNAADRTHKEAATWATRLTVVAIDNKRDLVVDGTLRDPANLRDLTARLKESGYEVEARIMAVNPETSLVRARLRFEEQVSEVGTGRFVNQKQHSTAYRGVASTVAVLEHEKLVGKVTLYDAHQRPVYENRLEADRWKDVPNAGRALDQERNRPPTLAERRDLITVLEDISALSRQRQGGKETEGHSVAERLVAARGDLARIEQSPVFQRAEAFHTLSAKEAIQRHPELDGAYKQLHELKQGWTVTTSQHEREVAYFSKRSELLDQLHSGRVPSGNVSLEESRRAIDSAANFKGVVVRDVGEVKSEFKGEVVATSSHHALVKVSELIAIRVEKDPLNQDMQIGEKLSIQHDGHKAQIYQQGKQPSRNQAQDAARDLGR